MLRSAASTTYDAWTTGEIGFTSPEVMEAGRLADDLIFEPGFVRGGPAAISEEWFMSPFSHLLEIDEVTGETEAGVLAVPSGPTSCCSSLQTNTEIGSDIDFFLLPPIDPDQPTPAIATASFATRSGRHARGAGVHGVRRQSGVG